MKVVVFKNDSLAFVELEMKAAGIVDFSTDLKNPDFATIAEGAGMLGLTAERPDQVRPMLTQAMAHAGPALVEVLVHRQELSMSPTITVEQMKGFSLFALKAVISGRGDELIDLAKINLFRSARPIRAPAGGPSGPPAGVRWRFSASARPPRR